MIVSASRRTDIPAFYMDWFLNGIKRGYVLARNPFNATRVRKVGMSPEDVDCFVFWTRNPKSLADSIGFLEAYANYTMVTITGYQSRYEKYLPPSEEIIKSFCRLSELTDVKRTIWRYDPVMIADGIDMDWHIGNFRNISRRLEGFTERCIISFIDIYRRKAGNVSSLGIREPDKNEISELAGAFSDIAEDYGLSLQTCCESVDLTGFGISSGACIDGRLVTTLNESAPVFEKDRNQRKGCNCVKSVDIGEYFTCLHDCAYCYANAGHGTSLGNYRRHDPGSPYLIERRTDENIKIEIS